MKTAGAAGRATRTAGPAPGAQAGRSAAAAQVAVAEAVAAPAHTAAGQQQGILQLAAAVDDAVDDATPPPAPGCRLALDPARLPAPGMRAVLNLRGHSIAIFGMQDGWRAIADSCPHQGASLAGGKVQDGAVQCPAHGLRFDLATGCLRQAPGLRVAVYPITTGPQGVTIGLPGKD